MLELGERADVVRAALFCLNNDHRRVLMDKYAEGLSVAEIAGRTGRSAKAVESLLSPSPRPAPGACCGPTSRVRREMEDMNPSILDQRDPEDDEQRIGRLIAEAGDPAVALGRNSSSGLRSLVLDSLGSPRAPRDGGDQGWWSVRPWLRRRRRRRGVGRYARYGRQTPGRRSPRPSREALGPQQNPRAGWQGLR